MSRADRIGERPRLDPARVETGGDAAPLTRTQIEAFEAMLRGRRAAHPRRGVSLREEIDRLAMPEIADAGIFRAGRPSDLLRYALAEILPRLDAGDEVVAIADAFLSEEIERQDDIAARRDEAVAP